MPSHLRVARLFGIDIRVHPTWFIMAALISWSFLGYFRQMLPGGNIILWWSAASGSAFLFFASLVAHELSHALAGRYFGMPTRFITLFMLGAVATMEINPRKPREGFWVAIAGPLMSMTIGILCVVGWGSLGGETSWEVLRAILGLAGLTNISVAVFNLVPAFPFDGGRVLHAILWWWTGDAGWAYLRAVDVGRIFAVIFIMLGVFLFFFLKGFNGLWLALIGWYLWQSGPSNIPPNEKKEEPSENSPE